jgi:hypothetical protein
MGYSFDAMIGDRCDIDTDAGQAGGLIRGRTSLAPCRARCVPRIVAPCAAGPLGISAAEQLPAVHGDGLAGHPARMR